MDFSKFSDDTFEVKDWVNGVFRAQHDEKQREAYTATLVTKLQRYIQEVNKSLEDISQQAVSNLPRVLRDVDTLKQEATFLWQQMQQVKDEIKSVEQRTSHSMQVLVRVDDVRTRVEQACQALKEADNWSSLASAVEDIFKSGDVEAIASQLRSMKSSLQVLKHSSDYEDKLMHLEALKNRLESNVSPNVVASFMQHNTEEAKRYHSIFETLDRKIELRNYYLKCHRGRIASKWQEIISGESDIKRSTELSEVSLLHEFYELLLSVWHTEAQWCCLVFGKDDAPAIVAQLLLEIILSVEWGPLNLINNGIQSKSYDKLSVLSQLHAVTYSFALNLKKALMVDGQLPKLEQFMLAKLSDAMWHPYIPHLDQYHVMETEALLTALSDISMDAHDVIDLSQLLEVSAAKLFSGAQVSLERCEKLTGFLGTCDLMQALERFFAEYCNRFARELRTIASLCGIRKGVAQTQFSEATEDEDWTVFQHCIRVIATCGSLLVNFGDFQQAFASSVSAHFSGFSVEKDTSMPWERYNYLKHGNPERYSQLLDLISSDQECLALLLPGSKKRFDDLNQQAQTLAFDVAFAQVKRKLSSLSDLIMENTDDSFVSQSEMPKFSVSPSERATHIGQYLMTLPQHLEQLTSTDGDEDAESRPLEIALRHGKLPFPPTPGDTQASEVELDHISDQWLGAIVRATETTYIEAIIQIKSLEANAARQLVADLDYMGNVIDSLGLTTSKQLVQLRDLLNVPSNAVEEFCIISSKTNQRLATVIANMRHMELE